MDDSLHEEVIRLLKDQTELLKKIDSLRDGYAWVGRNIGTIANQLHNGGVRQETREQAEKQLRILEEHCDKRSREDG